MAFPSYTIFLKNNSNQILAQVDDYLELRYNVTVSHPGSFSVRLNKGSQHQSSLAVGNRIEIRRNGSSVFSGEIYRVRRAYDLAPDTEVLEASGLDFTALLSRRIIIPPSGSAQMSINDNIDDALKYMVRYNAVTGFVADTNRVISGLSVSADTASHATVAILTGRYQNLLDKLQAWAEKYTLDFDVLLDSNGNPVFQTYVPQKGTDRTNTLVFSIARGNAQSWEYWLDTLDLANYVYTAGQGEGTERVIRTAYNQTSIDTYGRRELFVDGRELPTNAELDIKAAIALNERQLAEGASWKVLETSDSEWKSDWDIGDIVTSYDPRSNITKSAKILRIEVVVSDNNETVTPIIGVLQPTLLDTINLLYGTTADFTGADPAPSDPTAPAAPANLSYTSYVTQGNDGSQVATLRLSWDANTEYDLAYYLVEWQKNGETGWSSTQTANVSIDIPGLAAGGAYKARVYAVDKSANKSTASNFNSGNAITLTTDSTAPATPTGLSATAGFKLIGSSWNQNAETDLAGYDIQRSATGAFAGEEVNLKQARTHWFVDTNLAVSTQYWYRIRAVDTSLNASSWTTAVTTTTLQVGQSDIAANSIITNHIQANQVTADKMSVLQLSAISADMGSITAGIITGGTFRTAASGARVVTDSTGIKQYDATAQRAQILNDGSGWLGSSTAFAWTATGVLTAGGWTLGATTLTGGNVTLDSAGIISLPAGGTRQLVWWNSVDGALRYTSAIEAQSDGANSWIEWILFNPALSNTVLSYAMLVPTGLKIGGVFYPGTTSGGAQTTRSLYDAGATSGLAIAGGPFSTTGNFYPGTGSALQTSTYLYGGTALIGMSASSATSVVFKLANTHATSEKTEIQFGRASGDWYVGSDFNANGTSDFYVYGASALQLYINSTGIYPGPAGSAAYIVGGSTMSFMGGNVGIGATAPSWAKLYVEDTTDADTTLVAGVGSNSARASLMSFACGADANRGGLLLQHSGASYYVWADNSMNLRIKLDPPTAHDQGTVVGTQTSTLASKRVLGEFIDYDKALDTILATPLYDFKYRSGAYNDEMFTGIVSDYSPKFGMDRGKSFNPVTAFGYTVAAFKAQAQRIAVLELELAELKSRLN